METKLLIIRNPVTVTVADGDIDDIMRTALEDGVMRWCRKFEIVGEWLGDYASEQISRGGTLYFEEIEDGAVYALNREKFMNGLREFIREKAWECDCLILEDDGNYSLDCANIDAEAADIIIQYAVFGGLVYS